MICLFDSFATPLVSIQPVKLSQFPHSTFLVMTLLLSRWLFHVMCTQITNRQTKTCCHGETVCNNVATGCWSLDTFMWKISKTNLHASTIAHCIGFQFPSSWVQLPFCNAQQFDPLWQFFFFNYCFLSVFLQRKVISSDLKQTATLHTLQQLSRRARYTQVRKPV